MARAYYDDEAIAGFIEHVGTMDDRLIDDGTYFAAYLLRSTRRAAAAGRRAGRAIFAHTKKIAAETAPIRQCP